MNWLSFRHREPEKAPSSALYFTEDPVSGALSIETSLKSGMRHRVSILPEVEEGTIRELRITKIPAVSQGKAATSGPELVITSIAGEAREELWSRIGDEREGSSLPERVGRAVLWLLREAPLGLFDYNQEIIRYRGNVDVVSVLDSLKNVPVSVGREMLSTISRGEPRAKHFSQKLLQSLGSFRSEGRGEFFRDTLGLLEEMNSEGLVERISRASHLALISEIAALAPKGRMQVFRRMWSLRSDELSAAMGLLLDKMAVMSPGERKPWVAELGESAIHAQKEGVLLEFIGEMQGVSRQRHAFPLANFPGEPPAFFPLALQQRILAAKRPPRDVSALQGLPAQVALRGASKYPHVITRNLHLFPELSHTEFAELLLTGDGSGPGMRPSELLGWMKELRNVEGRVALRLLASTYPEVDRDVVDGVIDRLNVFAFDSSTAKLLIDAIHHAGLLDLVISRLNEVPESFLRVCESQCRLLEFRLQFGTAPVGVYQEWIAARIGNDRIRMRALEQEVRQIKDVLISSRPIPRELKEHRFFEPLAEIVFPDHSKVRGGEMVYRHAPDRSARLEGFRFRDRYRIALTAGQRMVLLPDSSLDHTSLERAQMPIQRALAEFASVGYRQEGMRSIIDRHLAQISKLPNSFRTREERIFGAFLLGHTGDLPLDRLRELLIAYHFAESPHLEDYLNGTRQQAEKTRHPEYSYLVELAELYADRIGDRIGSIADAVSANLRLIAHLPKFYEQIQAREEFSRRTDLANRFRTDQLGVTPALLGRIEGVLEGPRPSGKDGPGLSRLEVVGRIIEKEQRRAAAFIREVSGQTVEASEVNLGSFDPQALIAAAFPARPTLSPEEVLKAASREMFELFGEQRDVVRRELEKFHPEKDGSGRAGVLEAFFSLNHASARARSVAGVCIAGDLPAEGFPDMACQWNLTNFLQIVLRDPETKRCEGCVMLHLYDHPGGRVMTASLNPTSTYLHRVNEEELFQGILGVMIEFAEQNNIAAVGVSSIPTIRTNRTGGAFERALDAQIRTVGKQIDLGEDAIFSFTTVYRQRKIDLLWSSPKASGFSLPPHR